MAKGDHVFNNVISKLRGAFLTGLREYLKEKSKLAPIGSAWAASQGMDPDTWLAVYMPTTSSALRHLSSHPELVVLRNQLQTSEYMGGDPNGPAYSNATLIFESAMSRLFKTLLTLRGVGAGNQLLPEIANVRRAFLRTTEAAEDPNARARLLAECASDPRRRAQVTKDLNAVDDSMRWAQFRCEYLLRMVTHDCLKLGSG